LFFFILLFPLCLAAEEETGTDLKQSGSNLFSDSSDTLFWTILPEKDNHQKMLQKLKIATQEGEESFLRRGEITFFVSFGYVYMYQFILYDQIFRSVFREKDTSGELKDRNLYFAVLTSLVMALFISRNDLQSYYYINNGHYYYFPSYSGSMNFDRKEKGYNWYFNFFSWEF